MRLRRATPFVSLSLVVAFVVGGVALRPRGRVHESTPATGDHVYDDAERVAREALRSAESESGPHSLAAARATNTLVRALLENGRGWTTEAVALARRAVADTEPPRAPIAELVRSLVGLGAVLAASTDYDGALAALRRADQRVTADETGTSADLRVDVLDHLGSTLTLAGRYEEALAVLQRSLAIESRHAAAPAAMAATLELTTLAAQGAGLYPRAGVAIRRAIALRERATPRDDPARVDTLTLLAQQLWFEGRLTESRAASEEAARLGERTLRPTHPKLARTIRYLAATVADLGDLDRSRQQRERALALAVSEFGENHVETAAYLNSAAIGDQSVGDYVRARRRFSAALAAVETRYGPWHNFVATARLNLAVVHAQLGDYQLAEQEHDRAIAIWERILGPDHPYVAVALSELATVYRRRDRAPAARSLLERALAIRERQLGANHPQTARTLVDLSATLMQLDDRAHAQALADRALAIWRQRGARNAPDYASGMTLSANIRQQAGEYRAAEDLYREALGVFDRTFGRGSLEYAEAESGLSRTLAMRGKPDEALRSALHVETVGRDQLQLLLGALPERQAVEYAAARPRGLDVLVSLAVAVDAAVRPAIDAVIHARALVLDTIADRGRALYQRDTPERAEWRSAQQRLANLLVRGPGPMTRAQYAQTIDRARRERDAAEEAMAATDVSFRTERTRGQLGLDSVETALPADAALVSFVRYREDRPPGAPAPLRTQTVYAAFVVRRGQQPIALRLGEADAVDAQVERWRAALNSTLDAHEQDVVNRQGEMLRRMVWDPVAPYLGHARIVFIVPDGALALLPFAALPNASGGYLVEDGRLMHYLASERDLIPRDTRPLATGGLLAVGGAAFTGHRPHTTALRTTTSVVVPAPASLVLGPCELHARSFRPLPGTVREVEEISALWSRTTDPSGEHALRVLMGVDATETEFKQQASGYRILHLATHGFFITPGCSAGTSSATRGFGGLATTAAALADNPLQLSGLALAGANDATAGDPDDDGILTAEEVAALDLSGVEWAVLSACDTGLGTSHADEGVFGLRRAFQAAGARTVIMSLWSVDDAATRMWMRALYSARLLRQRSTAEAVNDATLSVLRSRRAAGLSTHPIYWASFVAVGDWH